MAVFQLGSIIRNRRIELGLSQEQLADGLCSVPTLSRIENGERMPTKNHFEMLMQRLGYSAIPLDFFTDRQDFLIHELKFKIRMAYVTGDIPLAIKLLDEFRSLHNEKSGIDQQFLLLYDTILHLEQYTPDEQLVKFETALQLTCPGYNDNQIPHVLSYEEIILLNNIAVRYDVPETREKAIQIFTILTEYLDSHRTDPEEALRTQPMILYNLSRSLGAGGHLDECIEICDRGIALAQKTGRCNYMGKLLYNRAWALMARNREGDRSSAAHTIKQTRDFFQIMADSISLGFANAFIKKHGFTPEEL